MVSKKDLSHIYIHLNDSVFGIFIDSFFLFWRFDHFGKAPYKKLFACKLMYVCMNATFTLIKVVVFIP